MSVAKITTVTPTWCYPMEPQFHNIITPSENQKKSYLNLSGSSPVYRYKLVFEGLSDDDFWFLHNHFCSAKGGYDTFDWCTVPSYIDADHDGTADGGNLTGRWVDGSFRFTPQPNSWDVEIVFEEEVT